MKAGGSLDRGRRLRHEVPSVPPRSGLSNLGAEVQDELRLLVERSGGRFDSPTVTSVPLGDVQLIARYLDGWARAGSEFQSGRVRFAGRPGLWHALDDLYPLQDPNRWDRLRAAVLADLESHGWVRESPPRGTTWILPERPL